MKFVYLVISLLLLVISILALTGLMPLLMFQSQSTSFNVLLGVIVVIGGIYAFANPLLLVYERAIILLLMFIVFVFAILPALNAVLTIPLNMSYTGRAVGVTVTSVLSTVYAIFAPG